MHEQAALRVCRHGKPSSSSLLRGTLEAEFARTRNRAWGEAVCGDPPPPVPRSLALLQALVPAPLMRRCPCAPVTSRRPPLTPSHGGLGFSMWIWGTPACRP